jgi:hypothetical protein
MGLGDFSSDPDNNPKKVIKQRVPDDLESIALRVDDAVKQVVGEGNYRVEGSGDGVTYYPDLPSHTGYAFMTVQPNRGSNYLYLHFDASAKKRVSANPIPSSSIPTAVEIPSNWKWNGSFRLSLEIGHSSDIDENTKKAIERSFNQLER